MTTEIEHKVPYPYPMMSEAQKWVRFPFHEMAVGDSFFEAIPGVTPTNKLRWARENQSLMQQIAQNARYYGKRTKKKFSAHFVEGGIRCWRIS